MSKVRLDIRGTQSYHNDETATQMTVIAELMRKEDDYILTFPEGEDSETTISVTSGGRVQVLKENMDEDESYEMVLEESKVFSSYYRTPFGKADALIFPTMVDAQMCDKTGSIELEYIVRVLGQQIINQRSFTYAAEKDFDA